MKTEIVQIRDLKEDEILGSTVVSMTTVSGETQKRDICTV